MPEQPSPAVPGEIEAALDRRFVRLASRRGGVHTDPEFLLSRAFLDRVEFFTGFPQRAVAAGRSGFYLPPATCYRLFQSSQGADFERPTAITLVGPCFRRERRYGAGRRFAFTMREVVFVGNETSVAEARDDFSLASLRLARKIGLDAGLEEAEDPFFTSTGRSKRLLQRLLRLKLELLAPTAGEWLAVGSFNLHRDFFGTRLGITVAGITAWTGCAAWGVERWRLALEERWGPRPGRWPADVRGALGLG